MKRNYPKLFKISKYHKRILSLLIVLVLIFNILPQVFFLSNIKASAATLATATIKSRFDAKMKELGWVDSSSMLVQEIYDDMWQDTSDLSVNRISEDIKTDTKAANAIGWRIVPEGGKTVLDYVYATASDASYADAAYASVADYAYSGSDLSNEETGLYKPNALNNDLCDVDLYYTIEYDEALSGYYRQYYVSTADQLAILLYYYETGFTSNLRAVTSECPANALASKLGIVLLNDIDLGGRDGECWKGYYSTSIRLEIDGQGHTVYNGRFENRIDSFLGRYVDDSHNYYPRYFSIHDVTFSNMYMGRSGGMFGTARYTYFNNVNWEYCLAAEAGNSNSIVFYLSYLYVYLKDCTINNSYVAGKAHCALFASYNGSRPYNAQSSFIGDDSGDATSFYYIDAPDSAEEAEAAWAGKTVGYDSATGEVVLNPESGGYKLDSQPPSIYENCATVNSAVYDAGANHSGTFVGCIQSGIIFKNCFSNSTIYANTQLGVFTGAAIGSGDGFYYPYNGEKTFINSYFEDCFTSGSIEGNRYLGGFIGVVFDDGRITSSSDHGKVVFKNCYSTSSVGMQYAAEAVGGFAGVVVGNIKSNTDLYGEDNIQHVFENCYVAGEVGGITIDTSTDGANTNTIGGFFGTYVNFNDEAKNASKLTTTNSTTGVVSAMAGSMSTSVQNGNYKAYAEPLKEDNTVKNNTVTLINCYYDKQTTAMRERDIGNPSMYFYNNEYKETGLVGTLSGLTGVYTQSSEVKGVAGLTDTVDMNGNNGTAWDSSMTNYYPQLQVFFNYEKPENYDELSDAAQAMHDKRAELYENCALASTATVLLDHYDQYLNDKGELVAADALVYDTVRDITRKFEFTTDSGNEIAWENNQARNQENNYISTIDSAGNGFTVSYEALNVDGSEITAEKRHNPEVLKIVLDKTEGEQYKCTEFAPGRQWVTVSAGTGDTIGERDLRLLPTAYLSAGGTMEVNVVYSDSNLTNEVTLDGNTLPKFNHYAGVAYALTDVSRMGTITSNQTITKYDSTRVNDKTSFAFYGGYRLTGNSTAVGLNSDTGQMYDQAFTNNIYDNNSTNGMTMVKVYETTMKSISTTDGSRQYLLEVGDEITKPDELEKWSGNAMFTEEDIGYYYMEYLWRLDDGRYLSDYKLVKIKASSHTVEIITGIINEEHEVNNTPDTEGFYTAIDQYVTDAIEKDDSGNDTWKGEYVSKGSDFTPNHPEDAYDGTYLYNMPVYYGNDLYYVKSKKIISTEANSVVGWRRTSDYRLTTLIVEAQNPDTGEWIEMARVDENSPTFDFNSAMYQYQFSGYTVEQDPNTKLFTVTEQDSVNREFKVQNGAATGGVESYIEFAFLTSNDEVINYNSSDSIRVTALFRENYADIQAEKQVLLNPESELTESVITDTKLTTTEGTVETTERTVYNSLEEADADYEVDNAGIDAANTGDTDSRKAVLSGDILTYRVKLYNAGFYDSSVVNVYDEVPEGCEYEANSMKIYRQSKDITSGSPFYGELNVVPTVEEEAEGSYIADYDAATGTLHWQIPTIELDYDYYVEYKVKVQQLDVAMQTDLLTNTAVWDYIMLNGDLDLDDAGTIIDTTTSIEHYQHNAIFTMDVDVDDETAESGMHYATYKITFKQNPEKAAENVSYKDVSFTNELPDGFEFKEDSKIELIKIDGDNEDLIKKFDLSNLYSSDNSSDIVIDTDNNAFKIENVTIDTNYTYLVQFTGTYLTPTETQDVVNKASIYYTVVTDNDESNANTKANSITKITRLSNQVETDVTHIYFNVEKTIEVEDPSQTFLFRIDRYEDEATAKTNGAVPLSTFYTQLHCTIPVMEDDKITGYQGNQIVQVDERGYYVVTEITDWSQTDYEFDGVTSVDGVRYSSNGVTTARNGSVICNQDAASVGFALPRQQYVSQAFSTSLGMLTEGSYLTARFTNTESIYAYLSGQSYSENGIKKDTGN